MCTGKDYKKMKLYGPSLWTGLTCLQLFLYSIMKMCFILLSHFEVVKDFELFWSTSHPLSVGLMLNYLRIFFQYSLFWIKKKEIWKRLFEKLKDLSTGWKVLKEFFNVLNFWMCVSFPYTENWDWLQWINLEKFGKIHF